MIDDECGAVGEMGIGRGNRSTGRKPVPEPLCPPHNPHDLTWARTRTPAVGKSATNRLSYVTAVFQPLAIPFTDMQYLVQNFVCIVSYP
jgi:hypothetical protein